MHPENEKKLRPKYTVRKIIEGDVEHIGSIKFSESVYSTDPNDVDSPFVLMPRKDPAAFAATLAYAQCCEPKLAAEIAVWLGKIAAAPPAFGSQGTRNYASTRAAAVDQI